MHILKRINPLSVGIVFACIGIALIGLILDVTSADAYDELPTGTVEADALTTCVEATPMVTIQVTNGYTFPISADINGKGGIVEPGENQNFELPFEGSILEPGTIDVGITFGEDGFGAFVIRVEYTGIDCSQSTTTTTVVPTTTVAVPPAEVCCSQVIERDDVYVTPPSTVPAPSDRPKPIKFTG